MKKSNKEIKYPPFKNNKLKYLIAVVVAFLFSFIMPILGQIYLGWYATGGAIPTILNLYLTNLVFKSIVFRMVKIETDKTIATEGKLTEAVNSKLAEASVKKKGLKDMAKIENNKQNHFKSFLEKLRKFRLQDKLIVMVASTFMVLRVLSEDRIYGMEAVPYIVIFNLFLYWAFFGFKQTN